MHALMKSLTNPQYYIDEIDRMHNKLLARGRLFVEKENGVLFYHISLYRKRFSKLIAQSIEDKTFLFGLGQESTLKIKNRSQATIENTLTDRLVEAVLVRLLSRDCENLYSDSLCSYRKGLSVKDTIYRISGAIKSHQKKDSAGHVNLYVLKADISGYCNSIPVDDDSPIWKKMEKLLSIIDKDHSVDAYLWQLIQRVIAPKYIGCNGQVMQNSIGLSFGSHVACLIYNYYVYEMDHQINAIPDLFYVRYCDDILLMHKDKKSVLYAYEIIQKRLQEDGLKVNQEKSKLIYLTLAGRPSADSCFVGCSKLDFLGAAIQADGCIQILPHHTAVLMKQIRHRVIVASRQAKHLPVEERGLLVCDAVRNALNPASSVAVGKLLKYIELHNDRQQLKQLDFQIAKWVVQTVTGIHDLSAFNRVSYRHCRQQWKLPSLLQIRNKGRLT